MIVFSRYSVVEADSYRFVLIDLPASHRVGDCIDVLKRHNVKIVVQLNESPSYGARFSREGIATRHLHCLVDNVPTKECVREFLQIAMNSRRKGAAVALQTVSGLGLNAVLVAVALVVLLNYSLDEALQALRRNKRGLLCAAHINYLRDFSRARAAAAVPCSPRTLRPAALFNRTLRSNWITSF